MSDKSECQRSSVFVLDQAKSKNIKSPSQVVQHQKWSREGNCTQRSSSEMDLQKMPNVTKMKQRVNYKQSGHCTAFVSARYISQRPPLLGRQSIILAKTNLLNYIIYSVYRMLLALLIGVIVIIIIIIHRQQKQQHLEILRPQTSDIHSHEWHKYSVNRFLCFVSVSDLFRKSLGNKCQLLYSVQFSLVHFSSVRFSILCVFRHLAIWPDLLSQLATLISHSVW